MISKAEAMKIAEDHYVIAEECDICGTHFQCTGCRTEVGDPAAHVVEKLDEAGAFE